MIIDCCPFFNELDILELRLRELDRIVDRFIVVQSVETHSGKPKPLYLQLEDPRWAPWRDRLETVVLPAISDAETRWVREQATRHVLVQHLTEQAPDDIVLISDVDEIPSSALVLDTIPQVTRDRWAGCLTNCYLYYLNLRIPKPFRCIGIARVETVRDLGAQAIRDGKRRPPIGPLPGGWHFSYQGGVAAIQTKLEAFAHEEFDTPQMKDPEWLASRIAARRDLYHLGWRPFTQVPLSELPRAIQDDPDRYAHMLLPWRT